MPYKIVVPNTDIEVLCDTPQEATDLVEHLHGSLVRVGNDSPSTSQPPEMDEEESGPKPKEGRSRRSHEELVTLRQEVMKQTENGLMAREIAKNLNVSVAFVYETRTNAKKERESEETSTPMETGAG